MKTEIQTPDMYESHEWASGAVTNYDVKAGQSAFATVPTANRTIIRTDATITVRLNSTSSDAITVAANTSFDCDFVSIGNIYITTSGAANIKLLLA